MHLFFNKIFMELRFIGQGYNLETNTSVAQVLIDNLNNVAFHTFKCMVAFASPSGVSGLAEHVNNSRNHIATTRVIVGIDQLATSKEALEKLLEWNADVFVFYSNQPNIFHPKIYIFEGDNLVSILIGSNNLTEMGLVKNIEASLLITFNKDEMQDESLLDQINTYFDTVLNGANPNLKSLTTELITQLVAEGIVPTEAKRREKYSKDFLPNVPAEVDENLVDNIKNLFPTIGLQVLPENFRPQRSKRSQTKPEIIPESDILTEIEITQTVKVPPIFPINNLWNFADENAVLIAEIGGPSRWKQISFAKANFETFFMLPTNVGGSGQINLKYLETNGNLQNEVEQCTSAKVKASSNYNLEPVVVRESTVPYNAANRPIIFFIKIDNTNFIYHFETNGTPLYNQLNVLLGARNGNSLRRNITTVATLRAACPSLYI